MAQGVVAEVEVTVNGYGHRKLFITVLVILLAFLFLWFGKMPPSTAAELVGAALALFTGGNVASKFAPQGGAPNGEKKP